MILFASVMLDPTSKIFIFRENVYSAQRTIASCTPSGQESGGRISPPHA